MSDQNPNNSRATTDGAESSDKQTSNVVDNSAKNTESGEKPFDESVFEDPRLWTHPRFKSLNERAKKAEELERKNKEAEEQRLAEAKKFEELANVRAQERDEFKNKFTQSLQDNRIIQESAKVGVVDIEAVLKLIDRSNISIDDQGNVLGVNEAIQSLTSSKPYLVGKNSNIKIGSGTNPVADQNTNHPSFKLSQLQDANFYREHEKEIETAYKLGRIEDDLAR